MRLRGVDGPAVGLYAKEDKSRVEPVAGVRTGVVDEDAIDRVDRRRGVVEISEIAIEVEATDPSSSFTALTALAELFRGIFWSCKRGMRWIDVIEVHA